MLRVVRALVILLWTLPLCVLVMAMAQLKMDKRAVAIARLWTRGVCRICGVRLHVEGLDLLDPSKPYVYVSNHQSHLDIPAVCAALHEYPVFVAKESVARVPVFGGTLRALGHIFIDRKAGRSALQKIADAGRRLAGKQSVYFFAEGTRSKTGGLLPFKRGAFVYAIASGQAVVPLVIRGGRDRFPSGSLLGLRPGPMDVQFTRPVEVTDYDATQVDVLLQRVRQIIEAHNPDDPAGQGSWRHVLPRSEAST